MRRRGLITGILFSLGLAAITTSVAHEIGPVPPAGVAPYGGELKSSEMTAFIAGDNPPTTFFTWSGHGGVAVDVVATTGQAGSFTISGIPSGASIVWAYMYEASWEQVPTKPASATFAGNALPSVLPFDHDSGWGYNGNQFYDLCAYRWDVTPLVTGNGNYSYSVSPLAIAYGEALAVVYSHPSERRRQIVINDGCESLQNASSSSNFASITADSASLFLFTQADDSSGTAELISFNGVVILGPGSVFYGNRGRAASLFQLPVQCVSGTNTVACSTDVDWFGWHLAVLETYGLPSALVTGGGWIPGQLPGPGSKKTFGFNAHSEGAKVWGQLQFKDHMTGMQVHSDTVKTLIIQSGDTVANFSGDCRVDGMSGYAFDCEVMDRGEPGHHLDWFSLNISGPGGFSYSAGDFLGGGNIQIHTPTDSDVRGGGLTPEVEPRGVVSSVASPDAGCTMSACPERSRRDARLIQNYPNPFGHTTVISYHMPSAVGGQRTAVNLSIYDLSGRLVTTLIDEKLPACGRSVTWKADDTPPGIYFVKLTAGGFTDTRKMTVLR